MNSSPEDKEPNQLDNDSVEVSVPTLTEEATVVDKPVDVSDPLQEKPSESTTDKAEPNKPPKRSRAAIVLSLIALMISFILVAAIAYGLFWIKPFYEEWQFALNERERLSNQVQLLQSDVLSHQENIQQQQQENQLLNSRLSDSANLLNEQQAQINSLRHTDRSDWQLAEVEYLCRLANQRLMSDRNAFVAMNLLLEADTILKDMERADLFAVRSQLADDIQALRAINRMDVVGSLIQLQSLGAAVRHLQFLPEKKLGSTQSYQSSPNNHTDNKFYAALQVLKDLYRVQPIVEPPEPVLELDQIAILKQQVTLRLVQAEYALMQGDNQLYEQSLGFAADAVDQYSAKSANKAVFLEQLSILQSFELTPDMPDITGSHTVVYEYVQARRSHPDSVNTQ